MAITIATQQPTGRPSSEDDEEFVVDGLDVVEDVTLAVDGLDVVEDVVLVVDDE